MNQIVSLQLVISTLRSCVKSISNRSHLLHLLDVQSHSSTPCLSFDQLNSISNHLSALQSRRSSSRIATSNLDCFSLSSTRHKSFIQHKSFTSTRLRQKEPPSDGIKSTYPSSDEPERGNAHTDAQAHNPRGDRGEYCKWL